MSPFAFIRIGLAHLVHADDLQIVSYRINYERSIVRLSRHLSSDAWLSVVLCSHLETSLPEVVDRSIAWCIERNMCRQMTRRRMLLLRLCSLQEEILVV